MKEKQWAHQKERICQHPLSGDDNDERERERERGNLNVATSS